MIDPEGIRRKAANLYRGYLSAWLEGDETFFPRVIPSNTTPDPSDLAATASAIRQLREGSKEILGFGYTVQWREVNSRSLGRNRFPERILFQTAEDFLRLIGKKQEFGTFSSAVNRLRTAFPSLEHWIRSNVAQMIDIAPEVEGLLGVVLFLRDHPRPCLFARELPVPVDTKFVERHQRVLREWLDVVLPPHVIRADEDHFERRYGLRYAEPHLHVRFLDLQLVQELGFSWPEFSLPLSTLAELPIQSAHVLVVENKVNLLTLPRYPRGLGLGGLGRGITLLRYCRWLGSIPITYWGDLDVEGFEILSALRSSFPQVRSIFMDVATLDHWQHIVIRGNGRQFDPPPHLTDAERDAYLRCRDQNLRLEQERIPQVEVLALLQPPAAHTVVEAG